MIRDEGVAAKEPRQPGNPPGMPRSGTQHRRQCGLVRLPTSLVRPPRIIGQAVACGTAGRDRMERRGIELPPLE